MKKWPLRLKITLLVGTVLTLACAALTVNSIFSARGYYSMLVSDSPDKIFSDTGKAEQSWPDGELILTEETSPFSTASRQFSIQGVAVMAAAILISVLVTYWIAGRLLRPLTALISSIQNVSQERLDKRVELPEATGEVRQLTDSYNSMLERLEESFEVQKNFASNAAHELKTPLAVIKTSLQVLEMDEEPSKEEYREFTQAAKVSLERLIGTVDALLALTRGADGETEKEIALQPLLNLIFSELLFKAETEGISLTISGDCRPVLGDPILFYRAFFNLVENAVKYNRPKGRVSVMLSDLGSHVQVQVSDTGIGMPEEALRHVFEPFYRADRSRSQKIPGSGLGLAVVKTIIGRFHGTVEIESAEGMGTTVTVLLENPVKKAE